jgi:hypothetical protein
MERLIESLESRLFLSASATVLTSDLKALAAEVKIIKVGYAAFGSELLADGKALKADLKRLKSAAKTNSKLFNALDKDTRGAYSKFGADLKAWTGPVAKDAATAVADAKTLLKKPGNAKLTAKVTADIAKVQAADSVGEAKVAAGVAGLEGAPVTAAGSIATANSGDAATQTAVATFQSHLAAVPTDVHAATTAFDGILSTLRTDLTA